jgi:hypothetical protein
MKYGRYRRRSSFARPVRRAGFLRRPALRQFLHHRARGIRLENLPGGLREFLDPSYLADTLSMTTAWIRTFAVYPSPETAAAACCQRSRTRSFFPATPQGIPSHPDGGGLVTTVEHADCDVPPLSAVVCGWRGSPAGRPGGPARQVEAFWKEPLLTAAHSIPRAAANSRRPAPQPSGTHGQCFAQSRSYPRSAVVAAPWKWSRRTSFELPHAEPFLRQ